MHDETKASHPVDGEAEDIQMTRTEEQPPIFGGRRQIAEAIAARERLYNMARECLYGHCPTDDTENDLDDMSPHDARELRMCINSRHVGVSSRPSFAPIPTGALSAKVDSNNRRTKDLGLDYCLTRTEWANILEEFGNQCAYCGGGVDDLQMDHLLPVCQDGGTEKYNVVPCCAQCNGHKSGALPERWLGAQKLAEISARLRKANP
jgi:hypothetical protein